MSFAHAEYPSTDVYLHVLSDQGSILATSSAYATHKYLSKQGDLDWRIPLWLQMALPSIIVLVVLFFPESPRWYVHFQKYTPDGNG